MIAKTFTRSRRPGHPGLLSALLFVVAAVAGCERVPLVAPTQSTISLFATANVIAANGSTQLIATVREQAGAAVPNGTVVTFTTTLGSIEPREARTQDGTVTVRLVSSGQSGTAIVKAFSGNSTSDAVEIRIGGAAASRVVLSATPSVVPGTGGTVQLVAVVTDSAGNRLAGVPVTFTATAGALGVGTVISDLNGEARNTLTTTRGSVVTASAGGQLAQVTIAVNVGPVVAVTPPTGVPTARQQAAVFAITVSPGGGLTGSPISNVRVDWGDDDFVNLGAVSGAINVAHVYDGGGTYLVTVTATDTSGQQSSVSTVVVIAEPLPLNVNISASASVARPNQPVTFTANVTSSGGGSTSVDLFEWTFIGADVTDRARTTGNSISYAFGSIGTKTIKVVVHGTFGSVGTGQIQISVELPPAP
ncbi:MAG: Ig-like domain-containing protein [Acidobacteria bacterium]|nr:Ig-like domain-containing protein [Acidobacteriota bacterium]